MWPFNSRGSRGTAAAPEPKELPPFAEFERNDASMKVWLPQLLSETLDWISKSADVSRPDVIRALMFEHLYGRAAYMALLAHVAHRLGEETLSQARIAARKAGSVDRMSTTMDTVDTDTRFSRQRHSHIEAVIIGKPTDNVRLELPTRLKEDLVVVARVHRLTPSSYVRKMLVQQICGERVHTNWQQAVGQIGRDIEQIEREA